MGRFVVAAIAGLAALGGVAAHGAPTAIPDFDLVLRVALAVFVTVIARRSSAVCLVAASGLALVASSPDAALFCVAFAVFAAALVGLSTGRLSGGVANVVIGAATFQVLLRLPAWGPSRSSAAVAALGTLTIVVSGIVAMDRRPRRRVLWAAGALLAGCVVLTTLSAASVLLNRSHLDDGVAAARAGFTAARRGNTARAVAELEQAERHFRRVEAALDSPWSRAARVVPIVGQQQDALRSLAGEATDLAQTGVLIAHEANVETLRVTAGRLDPARVSAMRAPLAEAEQVLARTRRTLRVMDSPWLVGPIEHRVENLRQAVRKASTAARTAAIGVDASSRLLGVAGPQRYFLMFTTPAESRAGGGFMGNWGILTVTNGQFELTRFGRTAELNTGGDAATKHIDAPPDYLARYARFQPAQEWRNVNMSPDFPSIAQVVDQLYRQSGGEAIDGVIAIDPEGLAQLLRLTGPVPVAGRSEPLTATNAAAFLVRDQYVSFGDTGQRVDYLENAAHAITERLMTSSLPTPSAVGRVLGRAARDGHLRAYSFDPTGERLFRRMGVAGQFPRGQAEVFGLVTQNAGGNKIDVFLHRSVSLDVQIDPSLGRATGTAEIRLRNDAPSAGLPDYVIGNSLRDVPKGVNRMYLSFYSRLAIARATLDGRPMRLERESERGMGVYSAFITIPPGAEATLQFALSGDARFAKTTAGYQYRLDLWHQSMVNPDDVTVRLGVQGGWSLRAPERGLRLDGAIGHYRGTPTRDLRFSAVLEH